MTITLISEARSAQAPSFPLSTQMFDADNAIGWAPHSHFAHELLWVEQGSVHVRVDAQVWKLSLGLALWIPAGTVHRVTADVAVSLGATHIDAHSSARPWAAPTLMTVTPALREMLLHDAQNDMPDEHRERVQQVCID
ncbi:MAG: cupin domain-containing protein, partial [Cryobacterium sp.]